MLRNRFRHWGRKLGLTESMMNLIGPTPSTPFKTLPDLYNAYLPLIAKAAGLMESEMKVPTHRTPYRDWEKPDLPYHWSFGTKNFGIAWFELSPLPGCCGVVVSHGAGVSSTYQGKGVGTVMNKLRVDMARLYGYGIMLCTDLVSNGPQRTILARNGWKDVHTFKNPRTHNRLAVSVIDL